MPSDYSELTVECKKSLKELDKHLPLENLRKCQEESAKLLRAAQELHAWVLERIT